jgi:hypothetical protein
MTGSFSLLRQQLWRAYAALKVTLTRLQRSDPMVQGSLYLQHRRCGKPTCHCAQGDLHASWVIARSEQGKGRTFMVPAAQRARLRQLTAEYRRYQKARAVLTKRHLQLVKLADALAQQRLQPWPPPPPAGSPRS